MQQQSTPNIINQPTPKQKRLSLGVYCPPKELFHHSARNNYHSPSESGISNQYLTSRKPNIPNSIYGISPFASQTQIPPISTEIVSFNRKVTRGYSKFLEEKGFITRRDQERQKVQEDLRRSLNNENPKVISNEIQKLITSTIVNESIKRPRVALRSTDNNINNGEVNKYDEKHRQLCNRILGGSFENNFLFMKMQKETALSPIVSNDKKYSKKPNSVNKALSFSGGNKLNDYSVTSRAEPPKIKKSASGLLPQSLTDLGRERPEKSQERKCPIDDLEIKVPSLTIIGNESVKGTEEIDSLNDLQFQTAIFSQTQLGEVKPENEKKVAKSSSSVRSRKFLNDTNTSSHRGDSKTKLEETLKKSPDNIFQTNLHQNIKNKKQFKKLGRKYQSFTEENVEPQTKLVPKLNAIAGGISKIGQLCDGAIQSTSRLGHKLRQQQFKTGKDFVNLDILMEKLNYGNTVENWEKSLKQVDVLESKKIQW